VRLKYELERREGQRGKREKKAVERGIGKSEKGREEEV